MSIHTDPTRPLEEDWYGDDWSVTDSVFFGIHVSSTSSHSALVTVWAGGELDPAQLTPADARRAAEEWPDILRRLADKAEGK